MEKSKISKVDPEQQKEADRLVQNIINDEEELEDHVSAMQIINYFKLYEASLTKYQVSEEDFFEKLSIKNKRIENYKFSSASKPVSIS